jgi:hypothetical protein
MEQRPTAFSNYASKQEPSITIQADKIRWTITATINFNGIKCEGVGICLSSGHGQLPRAEDYKNAYEAAKRDCQRAFTANLIAIYSHVLEIREYYEPPQQPVISDKKMV